MNHWYRVLLASLVIGLGGTGLSALFNTSLGTLDEAFAQSGGTCCDQAGATCHLFGPDGQIVSQPGAYFSPGKCG